MPRPNARERYPVPLFTDAELDSLAHHLSIAADAYRVDANNAAAPGNEVFSRLVEQFKRQERGVS